MTKYFVITKNWLNKHKTKKGGWTKQQVSTLCLDWPLTKGWQKGLIGRSITTVRKYQFEYFAEKPNKKQVREVLTINNCIAYLFKNVDKLHAEEFIKLIDLKNKYIELHRNTDKPEFYNLNL